MIFLSRMGIEERNPKACKRDFVGSMTLQETYGTHPRANMRAPERKMRLRQLRGYPITYQYSGRSSAIWPRKQSQTCRRGREIAIVSWSSLISGRYISIWRV